VLNFIYQNFDEILMIFNAVELFKGIELAIMQPALTLLLVSLNIYGQNCLLTQHTVSKFFQNLAISCYKDTLSFLEI